MISLDRISLFAGADFWSSLSYDSRVIPNALPTAARQSIGRTCEANHNSQSSTKRHLKLSGIKKWDCGITSGGTPAAIRLQVDFDDFSRAQ